MAHEVHTSLSHSPTAPAVSALPADDDPYRYGWRYLKQEQPDGSIKYVEVPLRKEDLLYPEEGDFIVNDRAHHRDAVYLFNVLHGLYANRNDVVVLSDCRVDWGSDKVKPLGPDVLVLFDTRKSLWKGTYYIAEEGGRPVLLIELASPSTRENDVGIKKDLYHRVGVYRYVIVDKGPKSEGPTRILGFQRNADGWLTVEPNARGRYDLEPIPLEIGVEDNRPWLYDTHTGERQREHIEVAQALKEESAARAQLEQRLRELEEELRRRSNPGN